MASPTPVLPEVGSTIVPPGCSSPDASAASTIRVAIRSFTEPPGFMYSTLASTSGLAPSVVRSSLTSGVLPTRSRSEFTYCTSAVYGPLLESVRGEGRGSAQARRRRRAGRRGPLRHGRLPLRGAEGRGDDGAPGDRQGRPHASGLHRLVRHGTAGPGDQRGGPPWLVRGRRRRGDGGGDPGRAPGLRARRGGGPAGVPPLGGGSGGPQPRPGRAGRPRP